MKQTALTLPHSPSYERADFVVSECNQHALAKLDAWPDWASYALILIGAPASGKTHLAQLWKQQSSACEAQLQQTDVVNAADHHVLIDDADRWVGADAERTLFHLLNQAKEQGRSALLTASRAPAEWNIALPDLTSRLNSLPQIILAPPDDALLKAVLTKHFSDRQVAVDGSVIDFIVTRSERSFASAQTIAAELDALALGAKRPITIPLVREWFEQQ